MPLYCETAISDAQCTRGTHAKILHLILGAVMFMIAFVIIGVSMALLVRSVFDREARMDRYQIDRAQNRTMTKQAAIQGVWYIGVFAVIWVPTYVVIFYEVSKTIETPTSLIIVHLVTMPLQGFGNALVYFRPKYLAAREGDPSSSRLIAVARVLKIDVPLMNFSSWIRSRTSHTTEMKSSKTASKTHLQTSNAESHPH